MPHSPLLIIIILALLEWRRLKAAVPGVLDVSKVVCTWFAVDFIVNVSATNLIL